jgi:tocopherol O-methyltransferase
VWGPGVTDRGAAFHHVDDLIQQRLPDATAARRVVDLGCGVGGSLIYLASRVPAIQAEGITISPAQAQRAAALLNERGLAQRVRCRQGNYLALPADIQQMDLAYAIEAFVHSADAGAFFRSAAGALRPGGVLCLCDDFLVAGAPETDRRLQRFRRGWRIGTLITPAAAAAEARAAGLEPVEDLDLTPHLELRRQRDRAISLVLAVLRPLRLRGENWLSLDGGSALQSCLLDGLVQYRFLTFRRRP